MRMVKTAGLLVLLAVAIVFPLLFPNPTVTGIAVFTLIFAAATTGWNILSGYTGYVALGIAPTLASGPKPLRRRARAGTSPGGFGPSFLGPLPGLLRAPS